MLFRKFLLFGILLFNYLTCCCQFGIIKGVVKSNKGDILQGAAVIYRSDITIGCITNEFGAYELKLPTGNRKFTCRYTGMISDTFSVNVKSNEITTFNITLKEVLFELESVDIKVGKFDKPIEEQTVSMVVIKPKLIENKNTRSIETVLDQTPGLNILDGEPQIRGGSGFTFGVGSKVAVIVDDMPMLSGDAGRPEWGFVPVENISQIEVIKGASSILSGSSALSGAIHIRTAYPKLKPLTKINLYSGFYSSPDIEGAKWWTDAPLITGANFLHSRQINSVDIVIGGNLNYDHGYIGPPIPGPFVTDTVSNFTNQQMASKRARINFNIRKRSKKLKGLNYGVNGNLMLSQSNMSFAWLDDTSGLYRAYPGAVFLQDQIIFNVDPFINLITQTSGRHHLRTRVLFSDNQMTANQSNRTITYYSDYMFQRSYPQLKGIDFIGGLTTSFTDSEASMYTGGGSPNNSLFNLSAYTQIEDNINETLNISVGGRFEYYQLNDTIKAYKPIFRGGLNLKIYQETYLRASYGQGYRFPTITERYIKTGIGNFGVFPNPELLPESSWNAEIGIKQGLKIGGIMGYLDIAGFWQEYQNTIEYMFGIWDLSNPASLAGFKFLNTGDSRVLGIDASFAGQIKFGKKCKGTFLTGYNYIVPKTLNPDFVYAVDDMNREYSYNSTSLDSNSGILKYRFLHNVKLDAEISYNEKLSIGMSAKYFSKIINMDGVIKDFEEITFNSGGDLQNIRYMDYFEDHRFGNWIFDARFSFNPSDKHKFAIIASNFLNRSYSLRPLKIEPPRTIVIQYTFKIDQN